MSTTTLTPDVMDARDRALDASGWGRRFTFVQPRNLAFWVYVVLVISGTLTLLQFLQPAFEAYQQSLALGAVVFAAFTLPFVLLFRHLDRFGSVPGKLALAAWVWGGFAATGAIALPANNAIISLWGKAFGNEFAFDWAPALTAPIDEELAKASGLLLLIALAPRLIRSAFDGLIVGAYLGLGFQIVEDVVYGYQGGSAGFGADQVANSSLTLGTRLAAGITSHWIYSGIFCAGLVWFIGRPNEPARRIRGLALMLFAMAMHGTWDAVAGLSRLTPLAIFLVYLFVPLLLIVVFVWAFTRSVAVEREWMRDLLMPEVVSGVLTVDDVDAVVGSRKQRKHFIRSGKGHTTHVHAKHVLEGATDLAQEIARARGEYTPEVQQARREVMVLRG